MNFDQTTPAPIKWNTRLKNDLTDPELADQTKPGKLNHKDLLAQLRKARFELGRKNDILSES